jgi:drug/metabolite transporter (DMT)-like permease
MAKSCKLIVVMVGGVLLLGKKYQTLDYLAACTIIAGLFVFQHDAARFGSSSFFGVCILLMSLVFDSLNSNYNEKVVAVRRCRTNARHLAVSCAQVLADATCSQFSHALTSWRAS